MKNWVLRKSNLVPSFFLFFFSQNFIYYLFTIKKGGPQYFKISEVGIVLAEFLQ